MNEVTGRRTHYITVRFHRGKFSSVHWSPWREHWPRSVQVAVDELKDQIALALEDGEVTG